MLESSQLLPSEAKEQEISVSQLSAALKNTLEKAFGSVRVRGEISGLKVHTSGHAYFALKDETAVLDGICWKGMHSKLSIIPQDGMDVICKGRITTYPGRSKYQIIVDSMELAGQGALLQILEERKKKLAAEGLFSAERKKALPFLPRTIGVVTSQTGAVIRDILHRLEDRFPTRVIVWPVLVQGQGAAEQIAAAIKGFNDIKDSNRPDLIIVARGGGSLEDLWAFNEEIVIRATSESKIPLISAVGHETDITLIDYVADRRAPTPTAAAEMAVPVRIELKAKIDDRGARLLSSISRYLAQRRTQVLASARGLPNMIHRLGEYMQRLDDRQDRLKQSLMMFCDKKRSALNTNFARLKHPKDLIEAKRVNIETLNRRLFQGIKTHQTRIENQFNTISLLLKSYSFHSTLERGFAIVKNDQNKPITSAKTAAASQNINVLFKDGAIEAQVTKLTDS